MGRIRIGTSGWVYPPWRGTFYPQGLTHKRELAYLSERLDSVEINGSFYSLQRPSSYQKWADQTPDDFVFAVKGSRFITHMKRLRDGDEPLANFLASGVLARGAQRGPDRREQPPAKPYIGWRQNSGAAEPLARIGSSTSSAAVASAWPVSKRAGRPATVASGKNHCTRTVATVAERPPPATNAPG
ncbi:DUF72 domain-containing protein, partial [Nocardia abscessus]|uniref:DUF72 domain-containing protein n=1 Tax=Nocardia abscessus TaxID=120957 RepID=UPI0024588896